MKKVCIFFFLVLVTMFSSTVKSQDCDQIIEKLQKSSDSYLYDYAQVFSSVQRNKLVPLLENLTNKTGINFFVITGTNIVNSSDVYGNQFLSAASKIKPSFNLVVGTNGIYFIHRGGECSKMMENIDHKSIRNKYFVSLCKVNIADKTIGFFTELSSAMLPTTSVQKSGVSQNNEVIKTKVAQKPVENQPVKKSTSKGSGWLALLFFLASLFVIIFFVVVIVRQRRKKMRKR